MRCRKSEKESARVSPKAMEHNAMQLDWKNTNNAEVKDGGRVRPLCRQSIEN